MNSDKDFQEAIESALHLVGCQQHDAGWNEAIQGKDPDLDAVEEREKNTLSEVMQLISERDTKRDAYVIGPDVEPKMGGKIIRRGQTVTIDMENNLRESCEFIQENGKFLMQQEQRKRAKERRDHEHTE